MNKILIYGPGCAKCTALAEMTKQAMQELGVSIPLEKVTDAMQFAVAGVLVTPALAVDGKVLISGRVPTKEEVKRILEDAMPSIKKEEEPCCCGCSPKVEIQSVSDSSNTCGCGGCCDGSSKCGGVWKRAVVWVVIILVLLAVVKMVNRQGKSAAGHAAVTTGFSGAGVDLADSQWSPQAVTYFDIER